MKDELPASLIEEQAEGGVGADDRRSQHDTESREQPLAADEFLLRLQRVARSSGAGFRCRCSVKVVSLRLWHEVLLLAYKVNLRATAKRQKSRSFATLRMTIHPFNSYPK